MNILKQKSCISALALVTLASITHQAQAAYSQMISFGDSLSDTGNVYTAFGGTYPPAPYWNGRFTDGPTWNELLANDLGLSAPTPSLTGGTNYAYGGARVLVDGDVPSLASQVNTYLAANNNQADPNAIFTLFGGGNDIKGVISSSWGFPTVVEAAQGLGTIAQQLIDAGANSILIANVPNVGLAPIAAGAEATATWATDTYFNSYITDYASMPGVAVVDTFAVSNAIAADPSAYGFNPATLGNSCIVDLAAAATTSCDDYLFFDDLHPTARANAEIANSTLAAAQSMAPAAVPVPATLPLFISAIAGLGLFRRKISISQ